MPDSLFTLPKNEYNNENTRVNTDTATIFISLSKNEKQYTGFERTFRRCHTRPHPHRQTCACAWTSTYAHPLTLARSRLRESAENLCAGAVAATTCDAASLMTDGSPPSPPPRPAPLFLRSGHAALLPASSVDNRSDASFLTLSTKACFNALFIALACMCLSLAVYACTVLIEFRAVGGRLRFMKHHAFWYIIRLTFHIH